MNNIIQLIERIGQSAELSPDNYADTVELSEISDEFKAALISKDKGLLEELLGTGHSLMCLVVPADDDDGDGDGEEEQSKSVAV